MFMDGGLRILRLDPVTGAKLSEDILDDRDPDTGDNLQIHVKGLNMPVALPDILSSDGRHLFMRSQRFVLDRSGSMDGGPLKQAKRAIRSCLGALSPEDRFNLVAFDNRTDLMHHAMVSGDRSGREMAERFRGGGIRCLGAGRLPAHLVVGVQYEPVRGKAAHRAARQY